jgi:hypothetical protein
LRNINLASVLSKIWADRTDECHELCKIDIFFSQIFKKKVMVKTSSSGGERQNNKHHQVEKGRIINKIYY